MVLNKDILYLFLVERFRLHGEGASTLVVVRVGWCGGIRAEVLETKLLCLAISQFLQVV